MTTRRAELGSIALRDVAPAVAGDEAPAPPRRVVEGVVFPYDVVYRHAGDVGPGAEVFRPGAFRESAARWAARTDGARIPILDRHDGVVVGTAELVDTPTALRFRGELLDVPEADAFATRLRAGVNGVSGEFDPIQRRAMRSPVGVEHLAADLVAIAGSHAPAYDQARAAMRSRSSTPGGRTMPAVTTPTSFVDTLTERIEAHRERRDAVTAIAEAEGRAPTDDELAELDSIEQALGKLGPILTRAREERTRRAAEASAASSAAGPATATSERAGQTSTVERSAVYQSPGQYLRDTASARRGDRAAATRIDRFMAERALADETTTNMAGLIPKAVVGGVTAGMGTRRPLVESFTSIDIGGTGLTMVRPTVTGGDVDEQVTQKTQVTSTAMTASGVETTLKTYAGGVDVAWQLIERSSPSALDLLFRRLANRYARRTEIVAAASFLTAIAGGPAAIVTTAGLTAAKANAAFIAGAGAIAAVDDIDEFPDTIWLSLTSWAALSGLVDTNGRPFFDGNTIGFGVGDQVRLKPVIVPRWAGANVVIGASEFVEKYELPGSPVEFRSIEAALLGTNISVAGLFAVNVLNANAFQRVTLTA